MFISRDIFHLHFGHFKNVKVLLDEAFSKKLFPEAVQSRILTDFTGDAYRLILEQGFETLAEYEKMMAGTMGNDDWKKWYEKFQPHVMSSHREILRVVK